MEEEDGDGWMNEVEVVSREGRGGGWKVQVQCKSQTRSEESTNPSGVERRGRWKGTS